jgi:lipopolysaccharide transport system permease protein
MSDPSPIVIQPTKGFGSLGLRDVWEYRDLLRFQVLREVKGKYRQMALGPLWIVLQPVINMVLFSIVFGSLARFDSGSVPYPVFSYVGLLPWQFFQTTAQRATGCLVMDMNVISKVYYPRLISPISALFSAWVDLVVCMVIMFGMLLFFVDIPWVRLPVVVGAILLSGAFGLGIGLWLACLAVKFRDVSFAVGHALRIFMYLTPVAYSATEIATRAPQWMKLYQLNPMFWVVEGFRWALIGDGIPPRSAMIVPVLAALLVLLSGAYVFRRTERTIVDLL